MKKLHIFVHLVKRRGDFFYGVKKIISGRSNVIENVFLTEKEYEIIKRVEYSNETIKLLKRIVSYRKIFTNIELTIKSCMNQHDECDKIFVYIADEGVWGVFISSLKNKLSNGKRVTVVNVQHGVDLLIGIRFKYLRKIVNKILFFLFGYPLFGMGFGGSQLDVYIVYGKKEKAYIQTLSPQARIFVSPSICLYQGLEEFASHQAKTKLSRNDIKNKILFTMQYIYVRSDYNYDEYQIYKLLFPLFNALNNKGYEIVFRLHPGTPDRDLSLRLLKQSGLFNIISIDTNLSLSKSIYESCSVFSFMSTTLVYSYYSGRMPVVIEGIFSDTEFPCVHEKLNILCWKHNLDNVLCKKHRYLKNHPELTVGKDIIAYFDD